jgi:hypothetical protein
LLDALSVPPLAQQKQFREENQEPIYCKARSRANWSSSDATAQKVLICSGSQMISARSAS